MNLNSILLVGYAQEKTKNIYKIIGIEIKNKRLSLGYTMSFIQSMSISYVSRIENGNIVATRDKLVLLCNEVDIKEYELDALLTIDETISELVKLYFQGKKLDRKVILKNLEQFSNYKKTICELLISISENDYDKIDEYIIELSPIIEDLEPLDMEIVTLAQMILFYKKHDFAPLLELGKTARHLFQNPYILTMINHYSFEAFVQIGYCDPKEYFDIDMEMLLKYGSDLVTTTQSDYYESLVINQSEKIKEDNFPAHILSDNYHALYNYLVNNSFKELRKSSGWVRAYLYYKKGMLAELSEYYQLTYEPDRFTTLEYVLITYIYSLAFKKPYEIRDYILGIGLPYSFSISSFTLSTLMLEKLIEISKECSRYKETMLAAENYIKFINKIKKVCMV